MSRTPLRRPERAIAAVEPRVLCGGEAGVFAGPPRRSGCMNICRLTQFEPVRAANDGRAKNAPPNSAVAEAAAARHCCTDSPQRNFFFCSNRSICTGSQLQK